MKARKRENGGKDETKRRVMVTNKEMATKKVEIETGRAPRRRGTTEEVRVNLGKRDKKRGWERREERRGEILGGERECVCV